MESDAAILAFAALAQPTRLDVFRLLVEHEPFKTIKHTRLGGKVVYDTRGAWR